MSSLSKNYVPLVREPQDGDGPLPPPPEDDGGFGVSFEAEFFPAPMRMSLRDYFAGQALASVAQHYSPQEPRTCARHAYRIADAMLELRATASEKPEDAA